MREEGAGQAPRPQRIEDAGTACRAPTKSAIHSRGVDGVKRLRGVADGESAGTSGGNLIGEAHLDNVPGFAAMDDAERAYDDQAAHRLAHRAGANANAAGQPRHGAVELELAFQAGARLGRAPAAGCKDG
jgi:hypothetical protein